MVLPVTGLWVFGRTDFKSGWQGVHEVAVALGAVFWVWAMRERAMAKQRIVVTINKSVFICTSSGD
jgi:hypothetical protein